MGVWGRIAVMASKEETELSKFLKNQKLLVLSTVDGRGNPWTSNLYYSVDRDLNLFFVSSPDTNHGMHITAHSQISFSVPWYDEKNLGNRKAVQGTGICKRITRAEEIIKLLKNHYKYYPLWKDVVTHKAMQNNLIKSRPYLIKPNYMKFWNDEVYGDEGVREFKF